MGANPAENHPISFRWIMAAIEKGATLISVDPRFTRTSAKAHIYAPIRSGTDIAFLGGLIKYILDNNLFHKEYVVEHTNASFLIDPRFAFKDGVFSGYDSSKRGYDKSTWNYQTNASAFPEDLVSRPIMFSCFAHYARYDPKACQDLLSNLLVYSGYMTGAPDKVSIMYAMGWTQHTYGTQNIRASTIVQLLLGNIGRAGGGINALRGESNVQGSTDHALLFDILPGYLKTPQAKDGTLAAYLAANTPTSKDPKSANWWQNYPKYMVSLLKWMYGDNATSKNEFGYQWLPKMANGANYSWLSMFEAMYAGKIKGFFAWGQNPARANATMNRKGWKT
jgi:formate dehydrogenase major subunit